MGQETFGNQFRRHRCGARLASRAVAHRAIPLAANHTTIGRDFDLDLFGIFGGGHFLTRLPTARTVLLFDGKLDDFEFRRQMIEVPSFRCDP